MKHTITAIALFTFAALAHAGQTLELKTLIEENGKRVQLLKQGMSRADVVRIMSDDVAHIPGGLVENPYKAKSFQQGDVAYEVLYYVTQQPSVERNAVTTPVLLKDGVVSGLGMEALRALKQ